MKTFFKDISKDLFLSILCYELYFFQMLMAFKWRVRYTPTQNICEKECFLLKSVADKKATDFPNELELLDTQGTESDKRETI